MTNRRSILALSAAMAMTMTGAHAAQGEAPIEEAAPSEAALTPEEQAAAAEYEAWATAFEESLDRKTGAVDLAGHQVRLTVPEDYYYLSKADARRVLEEAWGNPEDDSTLGMIFPAGVSPLDEGAIGVNLTYDADGYVSDADANEIDYDDLLDQMQRGTREENDWRYENGYGAIELVGWAERPDYDAEAHEMVWAKHLRFLPYPDGLTDEEMTAYASDTLNYNVRELGRKGVFNANFIASIDQLEEVREAAPDVLAMIAYKEGYRYDDYREGDKVAAYGIAGMVAGGGLLAKKAGLIGVLVLVLKKFGVFILAGAAALFGTVRKMFGAKG